MKPMSFLLSVVVACGLASVAAAQTYEEQVLEIVNQERWNNGQLPPLKGVSVLDGCSEGHSVDMGVDDFFGHCNPVTGKSPFQRMQDEGYFYNYAGENVAAGYGDPAAVMAGWMGSSGHRANILSTNYREIGIGYYYQGGDQNGIDYIDGNCSAYGTGGPFFRYWTQNFGRRNSVYPVVINREAYSTSELDVELYVYGAGWAAEMRFQNDGGPWSAWEPYAPGKSWRLAAGNGTKTVRAEIRHTGGSVKTATDTILLEASVTAVGDHLLPVVQPAFPNPFRQATTLRFQLEEDALVRVQVIDINGRVVATLQDGQLSAGDHETRWDGRDAQGMLAASGVYFLRVTAEASERVAKVVLKR